MGWERIDWIGLTQDRNKWRALLNAVMNARRFYSGCKTGGLSGSAQLRGVSLVLNEIFQDHRPVKGT
jgi:hypothetical protein